MPVNWYAALVLIVLVGIASVIFARSDYTKAANSEPTINETWHAALEIDVCGVVEPGLPLSNPTASSGFTSAGNGVLVIAPKVSAEAGDHATLAKFASEYSGMTLTNSSLKYPATGTVLYKNGQKCAKGTPDAGKVGTVQGPHVPLGLDGIEQQGNQARGWRPDHQGRIHQVRQRTVDCGRFRAQLGQAAQAQGFYRTRADPGPPGQRIGRDHHHDVADGHHDHRRWRHHDHVGTGHHDDRQELGHDHHGQVDDHDDRCSVNESSRPGRWGGDPAPAPHADDPQTDAPHCGRAHD